MLQQGEFADSIFFISVGLCEVRKIFDQQKPYFLKLLKAGDMFGHRSCVLGCRNLDTVMAKNYSTMAALSIDDYQNIA